MTPRASDLSYDMKQHVLRQIEHQLGSTNYNRVIDQMGEDGVLDLALSNLKDAPPPLPEKKKGFWKEWGWGLFWLSLAGIGLAINQEFVVGVFGLLWALSTLLQVWELIATWFKDNVGL